MKLKQVEVAEKVEKILSLDLGCIKFKLMDHEDGEGWTRIQVEETEKWYKRFLVLMLLYSEKVIAPTKLVDKFWHYHILDTQKYDEDCNHTFGYFVHHFPYFGMRGEDDRANLMKAGRDTADLYQEVFGESIDMLATVFSLCGPVNCAGCNNACVGVIAIYGKPHEKFSPVRPTVS